MSSNKATCADQVLRNDISVVIPTVGRAILKECLRSIAAGSELPGKVIVVDQSSNLEIREWLNVLGMLGVETKHIPSTQTGRAAGLNRGVECADTEFVAITDDDCLVAPDWLQNMRTHLKASPTAVVTGRVEAGGDEDVSIVVTSMSPVTFFRPRIKFDTMSGGNMGVSLAVRNQIGPFDEDGVVRCAEDGEWAYRTLRSGVAIQYAPDVVIYHCGWRNSQEREYQYREYALSHGGFYGKYLRRGDWFIGVRAMVLYLREFRRFFKGVVTRNVEDRRMAWACLRWLWPGILAGFRSPVPTIIPRASKSPEGLGQ
jgi:GT2 family glycosyltransferase